jgi:DNA-binding NtrC family response regulator
MQQLRSDTEAIDLDDLVREYLLSRTYSGNVRDLKQLMTRIVYRHVGSGPITVGDIPEEERPAMESLHDRSDQLFEQAIRRALVSGVGLKDISRAVTEAAIRIAVRDEEGNLQRAARKLGVTDRALQLRRAARREPEQSQDEGIPDSLPSDYSSPQPEQAVLAS